MQRLLIGFILLSSLVLATGAGASSFTTVALPDLNTDISTWTDGGRYNTIFPGLQTFNGVPFALAVDNEHHLAYMGNLSIPVNVYGVTRAYSIINSAYGSYGTNVGSMEFFGTGGAYYKVDLVEGYNVRDHYYGGYNNTIDNVTAVSAFGGERYRARLDMQIYNLPTIFATNTLESIQFNYMGQGGGGNPFLAAVTVEATAVPIPAALWLFGSGLAGLVGLRRRIAR